jgi:TonB family protein
MIPQLLRGRAPLTRVILAVALCALFYVPQAGAFQQNQIKIESTGPDRKLKVRITPEYPELARRTKIEGTVRVAVTVTPDGTVKEVKEIGGNPVLLGAVVHAVKQWKYEPAPKESVMEIKAAFLY